MAVERIVETVRDDVTITREEIDRMLKRAAELLDWANEVRLARSGRLFDSVGDVPPDADVLILETDALEYREALAGNDVSPARSLIARLAEETGRTLPEGSTDERLLGRALLRLLAEKSEETARRIETEIYRHQPSAQADECTDSLLNSGEPFTFDPQHSPELQPQPAINQMNWPPIAHAPVEPEGTPVDLGPLDGSPLFDMAWTEAVEDLIATKRWDRGKAACCCPRMIGQDQTDCRDAMNSRGER